MMQDLHGCQYPTCTAAEILKGFKETNKEYRGDIERQLQKISDGVTGMSEKLTQGLTNDALIQQSIMYLRENEAENKQAHIVLFKRLEVLEESRIAKGDLYKLLGLFVSVQGLLFVGYELLRRSL